MMQTRARARGHVTRKVERLAACVSLRMRELGSTPVSITLHDLSTHGFRATVAEALFSPGMHIVVTLPAIGEINGRVLWWRDGMLGAVFSIPLRADELRRAFPGSQPA